MAVNVSAGFSDATPQWVCECKKTFYGDSVADAFRNWWAHVGREHQEAFG